MSKDFCFNNTIHTTFNNSLLKDGATGATTINTMIPCTNPNNTITIQPINTNVSNTLKSDVSGDKWLNIASKPILDPFTKPISSFLQPNSLLTTSYKRDIDFQPNISVPNNLPNLNTISSSNNNVSQDSIKVTARYQNIMKGFTGQVLGGANHDKRHCREYNEAPQVNKEVLNAARKVDRENNGSAVNFILFHDCYLNDDDMYWLSSIFNTHTPKGLAVNMVDLSDNDIKLTRDHNLTYQDLPFFSFNSPYNTPRNILRLDLSNNQIGDAGAKVIADGLANGVFPITKQINLSGNKITKDGHKSLMIALESPKVKSVMVTLVQNISSFYDKSDKAVKATANFITKGLKYTIEEHNKSLKGTKWDSTTVRTDSMDKWKSCKEVGQNVQKGFIGGLIKCMPLAEAPPAMFACAGQQAGLELLDPDTFWCIAEINKFVDETEIIGDCTIF